MDIRGITKSDWDRIVSVFDAWWGGPSRDLAHPMFFYELGSQALVAYEGAELVGFLLGFLSDSGAPKERTAYVHLVGIHPEHRRRGVGKRLYEVFLDRASRLGATRAKAITNLGNEGSVHFHQALGFSVEEDADYAGPHRARLVFVRERLPAPARNEH